MFHQKLNGNICFTKQNKGFQLNILVLLSNPIFFTKHLRKPPKKQKKTIIHKPQTHKIQNPQNPNHCHAAQQAEQLKAL